VSLDGTNLMRLTELSTGNRSVNLSSYDFAPGTYKFYVKAVGMPSIINKMSNPVSYTVGANAVSRTITVNSPSAAGSVGSPVRVAATATSQYRVTGLRVYVDGTSGAYSSTGQVDAYVPMSKGQRLITLKAWDATGALWKKSFYITVN
jgi:hypothetical protein